MKIAQIVHNPTSGNAGHSKKDLVEMAKKAGFKVNYTSTHNEGWEKFVQNEMDIIILAGGDGTIHKLAEALLTHKILIKFIPVYLLPLGTANNIAKTFKISLDEDWKKSKLTEGETNKFFFGRLKGLKNENFFLESVGFGIFPELIFEMENNKIENEPPAEELQRTLKTLLTIVKEFKAQKAKIKVGGITIKGSFLLAELMNIRFIGPNFELAPQALPDDGYFDLVLIPERNRAELEDYICKMINGTAGKEDLQKFVKVMRVEKTKIKWNGSKAHVDDTLINDYSGKKLKMKVHKNALKIIEPVF